MTHRVHPYVFRLGHTKTWQSRWFDRKRFTQYLKEDTLLRQHLEQKLRSAHLEAVEIERSPNLVQVVIKTSRPGILIGRGGEGAEKLKEEIRKYLMKIRTRFNLSQDKQDVRLTIEEVRSPETHAAVIGQMIVDDIEKRLPFRRILKQTIEKVSASKEVRGVKIALKGRLDGAEMARYEWAKRGQIPLQTLRADVDYAEKTAFTAYGTVGVKVRVYKGEVFEKTKT